MTSEEFIRSYEESYEEIYGLGNKKKLCEEWFAREFPNGHAYSLRSHIAECMDAAEAGAQFQEGTIGHRLTEFHPRAFRLLVEYGIDYTPHSWDLEVVRSSSLQPQLNQCFLNSYQMMDAINKKLEPGEKPIVYVEGMVMGSLAYPMLHAWNATSLEATIARDWSMYTSCQWNRYLGIPFTQQEHHDLCSIVHPQEWNLIRLLHKDSFEPIESKLREILAGRTIEAVAS